MIFTVALYAAAGFVIAVLLGAMLLRVLPRLQFRQVAYEDAPQSHKAKTGTLTMGGVVFVAAMLPLVFSYGSPFTMELLFVVVTCAAIGFLDDYLKIRSGQNRGMRARTKFLAIALVAIMFLRLADGSTANFPRDVIFATGSYALVVPHWLWLLIGILAVTGATNGVNLTDGLDGLAAGTIVPPLGVLSAIALRAGLAVPMQAALLGAGAALGFLIYNRYPARIIMGDTGSLALGALLAGVAILSGEMLLIILIGGVFVAETLSVILQVAYFKVSGGKRIFRMSPLHHHFELSGWPETKVTARFWIASLVCSLVGLVLVR